MFYKRITHHTSLRLNAHLVCGIPQFRLDLILHNVAMDFTSHLLVPRREKTVIEEIGLRERQCDALQRRYLYEQTRISQDTHVLLRLCVLWNEGDEC